MPYDSAAVKIYNLNTGSKELGAIILYILIFLLLLSK